MSFDFPQHHGLDVGPEVCALLSSRQIINPQPQNWRVCAQSITFG
jgi:hypothetical protein